MVGDDITHKYLHLVFPDPRDRQNRDAMARAKSNRLWTLHFYEHGKGTEIPGVRGTLWAAYNGVAELVDHRQPQRPAHRPNLFDGDPPPDDRRLESAWFGEGASATVRAYREACKML